MGRTRLYPSAREAVVVAMLAVAAAAGIMSKYEDYRGDTEASRKAAMGKIMTAIFWIAAALSIFIHIPH